MRTNTAAVNAFVPLVGECESLLASLAIHAADHFGTGPDGVTWGAVADATRVRDLLRAALDTLEGKGA